MTSTVTIRRRADGSIDFAHYEAVARRARGLEVFRLAALSGRYLGWLLAVDVRGLLSEPETDARTQTR